MKAQRRHELQQNKLALWVVQFIQRVRPHVKKIVFGAVAVLAAILIVSLWRGYVARGQSVAWDDFFDTLSRGDVADLEKLAEENPGSAPGNWAALLAADVRLSRGCDMLFDNKQNAADELQKAVADYTTVIESSRQGQDELRGQAFFGRAKAQEALAGARPGNRDALAKAIADYEEVVGRWSNKPCAAAAGRQLAALQSEEGRKFYDKFAEPRPRASRQPGSSPEWDELLKKYPLDDGQFPKQPLFPEDLKGKGKTPEKPGAGAPPSGKPEPSKPEPPQKVPPKSESPKPEPAKPEPGKPEAGKPEPPKPQPTKPEPAKAQDAKTT